MTFILTNYQCDHTKLMIVFGEISLLIIEFLNFESR